MSSSSVPPTGPAATFSHDHLPIVNVNEAHVKDRSLGQRVADAVARTVGSWPFIIFQSCCLFCWIVANIYLAMHYKDKAFDPYPFILLNLVLSFQAAYTGPIVMMSQNRQSEKDRLMAEADYQTTLKAEEEVRVIMEHLAFQDELFHAMAEEERSAILGHLERQDKVLMLLMEEVKALRGEKTPPK